MAPRQDISGLPETRSDQDYYRYNDVHTDTARGTIGGLPDVRMDTAKGSIVTNDISMDTARGGTTLKVGPLKVWERDLMENPELPSLDYDYVRCFCESSLRPLLLTIIDDQS